MSDQPTAIPSYDADYDPDLDVDALFTRATGRAITAWIRPGDRLLELGCATGLMTEAFAGAGARVTAVDRSPAYLTRLRARGLDLDLIRQEDVEAVELLPGRFHHATATSLLHELADPVAFLRRTAVALAPGGLLHVTLQNPRSLHRLVALEMGLIDSLSELSARGERFGSTRLWTAEELCALAAEAGLEVLHRGGVFLKPLANGQLAQLPPAVLDGFERAARHLPEFAAMTYLVLRRA